VQHVARTGDTEKLTDVAEFSDIPSPVKVSSNGYAYDGPPYNAGSADILGKLEIKEDGLHRLQLSDLFGGTRNDPKNVYRLVIRKAAPDFAVVAWALHMELRNGDRNGVSKQHTPAKIWQARIFKSERPVFPHGCAHVLAPNRGDAALCRDICDLDLRAKGDLDVDQHHTVEDVGIALGEAFERALGSKRGILRAGYFLMPMDETLGLAAVDFGGRSSATVQTKVRVRYVGDLQGELVDDFFEGFARGARANVHVRVLYGRSSHHKIESLFKAFARALRAACWRDRRLARMLPSTKGLL